jgi:TonB family protein
MSRESGIGNRKPKSLSRFTIPHFRFPALLVASVLLATSSAAGQNAGAQLLKQPKPVYPEGPARGLKQGNVNLIGRIDTKGKVQDLRYVGSTLEAFLEPAVAAAQAWEFKPATRGGKPVEIAANIALRFRLEGDKRGELSSPIIGDLSVYPADASGRAIAPEGFPIRRGTDPKIRVEAVLDVSPDPKPRTLPVRVEAISPIGKKIVVFDQSVSVRAKASDAKISFTSNADPDWEDGVWLLRFVVENTEAGGGQFWAAVDPEHYQFVLPGQAIKSVRPQPGAPGKAPAPGQPKPTAAPAKKKKA